VEGASTRRGEAAEPAESAELEEEVESDRSERGTKLELVVSDIVVDVVD